MLKIFTLSILLFAVLNLNAQELMIETERVDNDITWTWNWDVASDIDRLVTANENGTLNIKIGDSWENIELDPNDPTVEARGIAIDNAGSIWITTTEHGLWEYDTNGVLSNYTSANSFLPVDKLRSLAIHENKMWISTDDEGLIKHDFSSQETTHYTMAQYSDLKTNRNLDPHIDANGKVYFKNREFLSSIAPDGQWTNEDMRFHIGGSGVKDIHIASETEIWLSMDGGVVLFDGTDYNVILQDQFRNFIQVFKDSRGDVWFSGLSTISGDGITLIHEGQNYFFDYDDYPGIPNQVFEFVEYQDTVMAVGTIGNSIAKFVFEEPSAINKLDNALLKVYPNPTASELIIDNKSNEVINNWTLSTMSGKKVLEGNASPNNINVTQINEGFYILTLDTRNGLLTKKITIVN